MKTVLFLGAGRHQRAAILRAKQLGYRVAAIDGNPDALGLEEADIADVVNFVEIPKAIEFAERIRPDGVLTITSDRAVVSVAAVAEALSGESDAALEHLNAAVATAERFRGFAADEEGFDSIRADPRYLAM